MVSGACFRTAQFCLRLYFCFCKPDQNEGEMAGGHVSIAEPSAATSHRFGGLEGWAGIHLQGMSSSPAGDVELEGGQVGLNVRCGVVHSCEISCEPQQHRAAVFGPDLTGPTHPRHRALVAAWCASCFGSCIHNSHLTICLGRLPFPFRSILTL